MRRDTSTYIKQNVWRQSITQINIFTNKLDNSDNTTMLWTFLLILVLNQSYHRTHIADELTYIIVLATHCFYLISVVFPLLHDKHFETNEKISNRIDESNTPFYNTIYRLVWLVGWIHFLFSSLFSRENCIWSPCFLFITARLLSLDTSGGTTS